MSTLLHKQKGNDKAGLTENEAYWMERRQEARDVLLNQTFDVMIVSVILCNAATIGIEQTLELKNQDTTPIQVIETFFLVIYIFELGLRQFGHGFWNCMRDPWVRFDYFLVVLGLVTSFMSIAGQSADALGPLMVLRSARLLRLAKTARMLMKFREFWMLIRGLINSLGVMFYTLTILTAILYVFGSVAIELITKHSLADRSKDEFNEAFREHVDLYFSSLPQAMMTLLQFVSVDNLSTIYKPLVEADPWLALYFITLILVISIIITNLITAVIVNSTLEQNILDKEQCEGDDTMKFKDLVTELREMFMRLDDDQSGNISQDEFLHIDDEDKETLCRAMQVESPSDIFKALDIDQSGYVNIHEFCDGIWQVIMSKAPPEVKRMEKQVNVMHWHLKETDAIRENMLRDVTAEIKAIKLELKKAFRKGGPLCSTGPAAIAVASGKDEPTAPAWALDMMRELKSLRSSNGQAPSPAVSEDLNLTESRMTTPGTSTPPASQVRSVTPGKRSGRSSTPKKPASSPKDETLAAQMGRVAAAPMLAPRPESSPPAPAVSPPKSPQSGSAKTSKLEPNPTETITKVPSDKFRSPRNLSTETITKVPSDKFSSPRSRAGTTEDVPGAGVGAEKLWQPPQSSVKAPQDMCAFGGDVVSSNKGTKGVGSIQAAMSSRIAAERSATSPPRLRIAQL